jgi:hypothetical protein
MEHLTVSGLPVLARICRGQLGTFDQHPIIGLCCWARNLVERFMTLCEDVAGGMGGT